MAYLHPGVYVEEQAGGARPIEGAGTSTAAFIGIAKKGPTDKALRITSWSQFVANYGEFMPESDLAYSVFGFFGNGGTACYVARVNHGDAEFAEGTLYTEQGNPSLAIRASSPGDWGNTLKIGITDGNNDPSGEFSLAIYNGEDVVEAFEDLSMDDNALNYVGKIINSASSHITLDDLAGPDYAIYTSTRDLAPGNEADLSQVFNTKIEIDGVTEEINLRAGAPSTSSVSAQHIANQINAAFMPNLGKNVASTVTVATSTYIRIVSPTSGEGSAIKFHPPAALDATEDVFGLVEYSWAFTGKDAEETFVEARGEMVLPISGGTGPALGSDDLVISLDNVPMAISLPSNGDLDAIIPAINNDLGFPIATTDGKYLILRATDKDSIGLSGSAVAKLFGPENDFYGYVCVATSSTDSATITSVSDAAALVTSTSRMMRIKLDNKATIQIDLGDGHDFDSGPINMDKIVENLNSQVKALTSIRKNVASPDGNKLTITSPSKGDSSRIAFYRSRDDEGALMDSDPVSALFPVVTSTQVFLSDKLRASQASIVGAVDLTDSTNQTSLLNSQLRVAIDGVSGGSSVAITFTSDTNTSVYAVAKAINTALNKRDAARVEHLSTGAGIRLSSQKSGKDSYIRLSVPQQSTTGAHVDNTVVANAVPLLFGSAVADSAKKTTDYNFVFSPGIRRPVTTANPEKLSGGTQDHDNVSNSDIFGELTIKDRNGKSINAGIHLFDAVDDMSLLSIPCIPPLAAKVDHNSLIGSAMAYCSNRKNVFFIADIPHNKATPVDAQLYVRDQLTASAGRDYTALYYPWISMFDPMGTVNKNRLVPPSGHLAGLYARIDGSRGVWKAPAGTEAGIAETNSLAKKIIDLDQDILNPIGLNCIRQLPGVGIVSWGARTLGVKTKPEWKYVPIRRTAIMIRESIFNGIQWAVFEPNNTQLWSALKLNIGAFMNGLFRAGAFQGDKASDAYFVRCGLGDTMTQGDIDRGQVIVEVGFAPLKPAEFVIVRIQQKVAQPQ